MNHRYATPKRLPPRRSSAGARPWAAFASLAGVAVLSMVGYLAQVGGTASKGDAIRKLEQEVASLKDEQGRAELQLAERQSIAAVEERVKTLGLVPTERIEYVVPTAALVARK